MAAQALRTGARQLAHALHPTPHCTTTALQSPSHARPDQGFQCETWQLCRTPCLPQHPHPTPQQSPTCSSLYSQTTP